MYQAVGDSVSGGFLRYMDIFDKNSYIIEGEDDTIESEKRLERRADI